MLNMKMIPHPKMQEIQAHHLKEFLFLIKKQNENKVWLVLAKKGQDKSGSLVKKRSNA